MQSSELSHIQRCLRIQSPSSSNLSKLREAHRCLLLNTINRSAAPEIQERHLEPNFWGQDSMPIDAYLCM